MQLLYITGIIMFKNDCRYKIAAKGDEFLIEFFGTGNQGSLKTLENGNRNSASKRHKLIELGLLIFSFII